MKATVALVAVLFFAFVQEAQARHERAYSQKQLLRIAVVKHRSVTWRLQDKAGVPRWPTAHKERHASSHYLHRLVRLWKERRREALQVYHRASSHVAGWLCIHNKEGSWTDGGSPYYGGLQMSYGWMGVVTDASRLSPAQQIAAADGVARAHGYNYDWMQHQWPNTFPPCAGLF